jgi:peptidoglycan/LPS O-acetylase OafA/YrhL
MINTPLQYNMFQKFYQKLTQNHIFDPRNNSLDFLRLILAIIVVVSHCSFIFGPEFKLYMHDFDGLETHLGTLSVYGFFALSGYLITGSSLSSITKFQNSDHPNTLAFADFITKRIKRIFPGFLVSLLVCCFVFVPLWMISKGEFWMRVLSGQYFLGVWEYTKSNFFLVINKERIGNVFGGSEINGPYWTLIHEFRLYLVTFALAIIGVFRSRVKFLIWFGGLWILYVLVAFNQDFRNLLNLLIGDARTVILFTYFFAGSFWYMFKDRISYKISYGILGFLVLFLGYKFDVFPFVSPLIFSYLCLWLGVFLPVRNLAKRIGDYSYGIYIYSWPIQQLTWSLGLPDILGFPVFLLLNISLSALAGFLSWNIVEKRFLNRV